VLFIGYGLLKYRKGNWSKVDLSLVLLISIGIASLSIFPQIGDVLRTALRLDNRLFSLLVFSNLLLFGLFFFLLNLIRASNRRSREIVRALARYSYNERYFSKRESHSETLAADKGKLLVIIPAYNEQEAILGVLTRLPKELAGYEAELSALLGKDLAALNTTAAGLGVPGIYVPAATVK